MNFLVTEDKKMRNINESVISLHLGVDEKRIAGIAAVLTHNRYEILEGSNLVDFKAAANTNIVLGWVYHPSNYFFHNIPFWTNLYWFGL